MEKIEYSIAGAINNLLNKINEELTEIKSHSKNVYEIQEIYKFKQLIMKKGDDLINDLE